VPAVFATDSNNNSSRATTKATRTATKDGGGNFADATALGPAAAAILAGLMCQWKNKNTKDLISLSLLPSFVLIQNQSKRLDENF